MVGLEAGNRLDKGHAMDMPTNVAPCCLRFEILKADIYYIIYITLLYYLYYITSYD